MSKGDKTPKIGATHLAAMARMGLRELRSAMFPDSNVAQQPELGLYGTRTSGEITNDRRTEDKQQEQNPPSVVEEHVKAAERAGREPGRAERDVGRGRD